MKHDELKIKWEMCLERIQEQDDEIEVLEREVDTKLCITGE